MSNLDREGVSWFNIAIEKLILGFEDILDNNIHFESIDHIRVTALILAGHAHMDLWAWGISERRFRVHRI